MSFSAGRMKTRASCIRDCIPTSFHVFQLASGTHQVRLELVDNAHNPLGNPESTQTIAFTVAEPPGGELRLESVLDGLNIPVSMALAPDGRLFYNELLNGNVRIVNTAHYSP